ncbi:MAG: cbb3-type cytochrome c oxidase subunit I [Chthoniobacterales bacterium]
MTAGTTTVHPSMNPGSLTAGMPTSIDRSTRFPVLLFVGLGTAWLIVGSLLATIAAFALILPGWFDWAAFLNYGRVQPAGMNALIYGWASQVGIGLGIWLTTRLSGVELRHHTLLVCGAVIWNLALLVGVLSILAGGSTSLQFLEMPSGITPVLLIAYALIAAWAVVMFRLRRPGSVVYVSMWYLLAAFLAFPWLYATAQIFLVWNPVPGSATGPIHGWFTNGLIGLWLVPLALGMIYYFIPKGVGRPVHSYGLAVFGFWSLLVLSNWSGLNQLVGGPVPVWLVSVSVVATILLVIPTIAVGSNLHLTAVGATGVKSDGTMPFFVVGFWAYAIYTVINALAVLPSASSVFQFTMLAPGQTTLIVGGLVTLTFFGAIYSLLPRLTGLTVAFPGLRPVVLWVSVAALGMIITCALVGGLTQGFSMRDAEVTFIFSQKFAAPYRVVVALSELTLLVINVLFAATFAVTLARPVVASKRVERVDPPTRTPGEVVSV